MRNAIRITLLLTPTVGVVLFFMGSVLYRAIVQSFGLYDFSGTSEGLSLVHWQEVLAARRFWRAFQWSAYIATASALIAVALAYPIALWLRKPFAGSMTLSAILKAPLLVPGLVAAFLLVNVISYHGFVNEFLVWTGLWDAPARMQNDANGFAVIGLQVWKQMPFAFLLLSGAVQSIPDQVLNAAQDLGAGTVARFRKVILPLSTKAMQAALVLIFIGAAGDFSFQAVAGPSSINSMATYMASLQGAEGDWNGAAVVAVMLMALSLFGALGLTALVQLATRAMGRVA
ncbi:ABC transporter permease [Pelagibacterium halotolerans]|uniref:ABC transporter permease n=1 Tax=Pelagibacterium halotolerans TaxID=531813 RepID=UPI00384C3430